MSGPELLERIRRQADQAVERARERFGVDLDGSEESLAFVDRLLESVREALRQEPSADERKRKAVAVAVPWGAYLGEVIRASCGGLWLEDVEGIPKGVSVLSVGRQAALPVPAVAAFVLGEPVDLGGRTVDRASDYCAWIRGRQREWLEQTLCGTCADLDALREEMSGDAALSDGLVEALEVAIRTAQVRWGLSLDFSTESLGGLDRLLDELHRIAAAPGSRPTDEQLTENALRWGAYFGEVVRRRHGGRWTQEEIPGQGSVLRLQVADVPVFPLSRVLKRIRDGLPPTLVEHHRELSDRLGPASGPSLPTR